MNNLFATNSNDGAMNGNQLEKTAQLTSHAMRIANDVLQQVANYEGTEPTVDELTAMIKESMTDHDKMDELIELFVELQYEKVDYLKSESEDTINKMIKSQQSKRSRSKAKVMTMENYRSMLTGAVAENLLRMASGKPKFVISGVNGEISLYSDDELQKLANSPGELARVIRNVQSKKSIAKHKAGFTVESPRWKQLLALEEQLKDARDGITPKSINNEVIKQLKERLANVDDVNNLKGNDAKAMLAAMMEIINAKDNG